MPVSSLFVPISTRVTGVLSVFVAAVLAAAPAPALAQTVIDASSLGVSEALPFRDRTDEVGMPIPVPAGLTPRTLVATVQTPVDLVGGDLEAWSGDLLLARVPLDGAEEFIRVEVPLGRATVRDQVADVTLRTVLDTGGQACPDWTERALILRDSEVVYDGEPDAPGVLADFVPPVLESLEIYLPDPPSPAEAQAAADLAATAAARFGKRGLEIQVLPDSATRAATASPFTRRVEIREDEQTRIDLVKAPVPTVEITGNSTTLSQQSRSVSSGLRTLAITDSVTIDAPLAPPRALITEATLDELGSGSVSARSVGTVRADFGIDQSQLATVSGDVTVDLLGSYSPPPAGHSGLMVVEAGGTVLDSWVADGSGVIDRTVTVPATLLGRYTEVSVGMQTAGESGVCGVAQPLTLLVSGASRVRVSEPASPAPGGFDSLPQALMPSMRVATGSGSLADVGRAITILSELQRLSAVALRPEWVSVEDLVNSRAPGILVTSESTPDGFSLPLELTSGRALDVMSQGQEPATVRFYEDVDFASLQVVEDDGRAVVVASTSSGSAELDRTLDWLGAEPTRWNELRGNVLFTAPGRDPVALSSTESVDAGGPGSDTSPDVRTALIVGSMTAVAGIALAGVVWLATRRRRSGRRS